MRHAGVDANADRGTTDAPRRGQQSPVLAGKYRAGLVINPGSRRSSKNFEKIRHIAAGCEQLYFEVAKEPDDIPSILSRLAARDVDILAICGGDGTVSNVLTRLLIARPFARMPMIAVLPGGTANMICGDIGFQGNLRPAVERLAMWLGHGTGQASTRQRRIVRVQSSTAPDARFGMFFGAGAVVQGIHYTNENIHSRGLKSELSLGLGLVRSMWGIARRNPRFYQPTEMLVCQDGSDEALRHSVTLIIATSLERLFLNLRPYWGAANGKPLHVSSVCNPANRFLRTLPSLLRGAKTQYLTEANGYRSCNVDSLRLSFDGYYTLDGEIHPAGTATGAIEISAGDELAFLDIDR